MSAPASSGARGAFVWRLCVALLIALCLYWAATGIDFQALRRTLLGAKLAPLAISAPILIVLVCILRALRWRLMLHTSGLEMPIGRVYLYTVISLGLAAVSPGQSGEAIKLAYARSAHGVGAALGAGGFLLERLLDLLVLALLTIVAIGLNAATLQTGVALPLFAVAAATAVLVIVPFLPRGAFARWLQPVFTSFSALAKSPRLAAAIASLTIACWLVTALLWQQIMSSVSVEISFTQTLAVVGIATLANVASLIPGGIGVSELTVSSLLVLLGHTPETAFSAALVLRVASLWFLVLGLVHWAALNFWLSR